MHIKIVAEGHTHAGKPVPQGTVLDVDEATGRWLERHKIGTAVRPLPAAEPAEKPEKSK